MSKEEALEVIKYAHSIDLAQNNLYEVLKPLVDYANEKNIKIKLTGVF